MRISQAFLAGHCSPFRLPPSMNEREVCLTEIGFSLLLSLSFFLPFILCGPNWVIVRLRRRLRRTAVVAVATTGELQSFCNGPNYVA